MPPRRDPLRRLLGNHLDPLHTFRVMGRLVRRVALKPGSPPGTLVHTGEKRVEQVRIRILDYDQSSIREVAADTVEECFPFGDSPTVTWINVDGLHDVELIDALGRHFGLHPLVVEDILNVGERPKLEEFDDHLFVSLKMLAIPEDALRVEEEQLALAFGRNWVLTFQEHPGDVFEPVRDRLRAGKGRIRSRGADYLAYALIDAVVDSYFGILETVGDQVELLEENALELRGDDTMRRIHDLRREMIVVRKSIWPARDMMAALLRTESKVIGEETRLFLRDVYDHSVQVIDGVENLRDVVTGLKDVYLSTLSTRTNEVMKVLTIIATIFIPLTFIAGVYGMNFEVMPELAIWWAYPAVLGLMFGIALAMLVYFQRRGWF